MQNVREKMFIDKRAQMKGVATTIIALIIGLVIGAVAMYAIPTRPAEGVTTVTTTIPGATVTMATTVTTTVTKPPAPFKGGTLVIAQSEDADTLDPHKTGLIPAWEVFLCIFDPYIILDENLVIRPHLLEYWEVSPDGLTYTWYLRKGVKFHCGYSFDASVVKYTMERHKNPETASPTSDIFLGALESVEIVDDYTVKLHMKVPNRFFMTLLNEAYTAPVCPDCIEKYGNDYGVTHVCGTGPFKFVEWVKDEHIKLERNDEYNWAPIYTLHQGPSLLEGITFRIIPESSTRISELLTGGVDMIAVGGIPPYEFERLYESPDMTVGKTLYGLRASYLGFNVEKPPFDDEKVRLAVAHTVDREVIVESVLYGLWTPAYSPIPPGMRPYYNPNSKDVAPELNKMRAEELLDEAGWKKEADGWRYKDGEILEVSTVVTAGEEDNMKITTILQQQLKDIGMKLNIQELDFTGYINALQAGDYNLHVWIYGFETPDVLIFFFAEEMIPWYNYFRVKDPELEATIRDGTATLDTAKATEYFYKAQEIIVNKAYWVPIAYPPEMTAWGAWVKGFELVPVRNNFMYMNTYIEEAAKP